MALPSAGAPAALAQTGGALGLDPATARQGTALLVGVGEPLLSSAGRPADSMTIALARGMRVDRAARRRFCVQEDACPPSSRIGFGRFVLAVRGFVPGGGETELVWSIDAYLGKPLKRGDAASVVLSGRLLGADSVGALLAPALGTSVPATVTTVGRLVPTAGTYGVELRFAQLPARLDVAAPITATPSRLELSLSAVRRVRKDFVRHIRVRTLSGFEVRRIRDHRLVGHHLLRTPPRCHGSWPAELRVGFAGEVKRTASDIACSAAA